MKIIIASAPQKTLFIISLKEKRTSGSRGSLDIKKYVNVIESLFLNLICLIRSVLSSVLSLSPILQKPPSAPKIVFGSLEFLSPSSSLKTSKSDSE